MGFQLLESTTGWIHSASNKYKMIL